MTQRTITIVLGESDNPEQPIDNADRVKFTNATGATITLTVPKDMKPTPDREVADGETVTRNGYRLPYKLGAELTYSWDDAERIRPRTGTIRVT